MRYIKKFNLIQMEQDQGTVNSVSVGSDQVTTKAWRALIIKK